jgi:ParB family chromosome partitioning protein
VRACKKLGIKQAAVEERTFDSEDEILKQLIETNIRQRGIGNANPVKFGRCIAELERIYGIKNGGDRVSESRTTNGPSGQKTQAGLAEDL